MRKKVTPFLVLMPLVSLRQHAKIWVNVHLNGKLIKMELDTGASISLVNHKIWKETLVSIP